MWKEIRAQRKQRIANKRAPIDKMRPVLSGGVTKATDVGERGVLGTDNRDTVCTGNSIQCQERNKIRKRTGEFQTDTGEVGEETRFR